MFPYSFQIYKIILCTFVYLRGHTLAIKFILHIVTISGLFKHFWLLHGFRSVAMYVHAVRFALITSIHYKCAMQFNESAAVSVYVKNAKIPRYIVITSGLH